MDSSPLVIPHSAPQHPQARPVWVRAVGGARGHRTDVRRVGDVTLVTLQGEISEQFHGVEMGRRLRGRVVIDLAQVDRITSFGVREWLTMLRELYATEVTFARCSEPFMHQLSMIRAFAGNHTIQSFFAPYVCPCCGTQFSALYDAIEDGPAIVQRVPVEVDCPRCDAPTYFDDEPHLYLSVEHHLVQRRDGLVDEALAQLEPLQAVPIRKAVVGNETWITLNARLDEGLRLNRALQGLEGTVVFDLSAVNGLTAEGMARFVERLCTLGREVAQVRLVGCPYDLLEHMVALAAAGRADRRITVSSAYVSARSEAGGTPRWVLLDLHAPSTVAALRRGHAPQVSLDWREGVLDVSHATPLLRRALDQVVQVEPAPAPAALYAGNTGSVPSLPRSTGPLPVRELMSAANGSAGARPSPVARLTTNPRMVNVFAGVSTQAPLQASATVIGLVCLFVGVLVGTAGLVGGLLLVALESNQPEASVVEGAAGVWEGAPAWASEPFSRSGQGLSLVGTSRAGSLAEGMRLARVNMTDLMITRLAESVARRGDFEADIVPRGALSDAERAAALNVFEDRLGLTVPQQVEDLVDRSPWGVKVAARYAMSESDWSNATEYFAETASFRGVTVGRVFPTLAPRLGSGASLMVVATTPWMRDAKPGDVVVAVAEQAVSDLGRFRELVEQQWVRTPSGGFLELLLERDGRRRPIEFRKP